MVATILEFRQMGEFIRGFKSKLKKATARALFRTINAASNLAKKNARNNFKGTRERPKTGALVHAIFPGFTIGGQPGRQFIAQSHVGVRSHKGNAGTRPYGRIREYGGKIKPVKAHYLWIPLFGPKTRFPGPHQFHTMTPTEFIREMDKGTSNVEFFITPGHRDKIAGVQYAVTSKPRMPKPKVGTLTGPAIRRAAIKKGRVSLKTIPLFALKSMVKQKANPYVTPAVAAEYAQFGRRLDEELAKANITKDGGPVPPEKG